MKKLFISSLLAISAIAFSAMPAFAIADPDTAPSINAVFAYDFDDGSVGVLVEYFLDYAVPPTETATEAYLVSFIDTDGVTQLKSAAPYTFQNSGYDEGLVWIKFSTDEVATYSIDSANIASYKIWLVGNPALSWSGDPPKTIAGIDQWNTTGDMSVLLALRVLYYADDFELSWSLDLIESTSQGNKLTTLGASYFENVILNLRTLAPAAFSASTIAPTIENIDYTTEFEAILTDGTGTAVGSPITLAEGSNIVNVTGLGTFTVELAQGTSGTASTLVATVTGSPATLVAGTNTITVTGVVGNITVTVNRNDTAAGKDTEVSGTGFDLTTLGARFGMSRWMISGIVWMILSVVICAAYIGKRRQQFEYGDGGTKGIMIIFCLCIVAGTLLGLLHPLVGVLMFIGFGVLTGYVLFFKGANI